MFKEHSRKESLKLFHDDLRYQAINYIEKKLALHDHMTISEVKQAISFIEDMKVCNGDKEIEDFKEVLSEDFGSRTLRFLESEEERFQIKNAKSEPNFFLAKNGSIYNFLAQVHSVLIGHYELSKAHAQGDAPVSKICYTHDLMNHTQIVQDIEKTTKAAKTGDNSTSVMDIRRGGTTFYGAKIIAGEHDVFVAPTIENFTGDEINVVGSKANKIFHFGGQVLHGIILDEFENSMELIAEDRHLTDGLKPTLTRGKINWSKKQETGEIYATVELKILSCAFIDLIDTDKMPEHFAIGSDGITLKKIDEDKLLELDQIARKDESDIVPICIFNARLDLIQDENTKEHYLKMNEFIVKINTVEMVSRKDPNYQPQSLRRCSIE